jgi:histone H3/H4
MSNEAVDRQQQEMRNFMSLLPLTSEIAGLPETEAGRFLNEGQMDVRATALKNAYKIAKKVIRDIAREASQPASHQGTTQG